MTVSFDRTLQERETIRKIAERAVNSSLSSYSSALDIEMDVTAVHANGCPLKLDELLAADDFNFLHDIYGIRRHLDRETGQLQNCFMPRFTRR